MFPHPDQPHGSPLGWATYLAGGTFAAEHAGGRVATVGIEAMRFLRPVSVGDEVSCYCALQEAGETSVTVRIETWARERGAKEAEKVTQGVFTFVAVGEDGRPRAMPGQDESQEAKERRG